MGRDWKQAMPYIMASKKRMRENNEDYRNIEHFKIAAEQIETRIIAITEYLTREVDDASEQKRLRLGYRAKLIQILLDNVDSPDVEPIDLPEE